MRFIYHYLLAMSLLACQDGSSQKTSSAEINTSYWNEGKAELCRYALSQQRYGEERTGDLVQIFVAEDFLTGKQVKNENYTDKRSTRVLKRIETRQFNTGIYQYNMFTSSFTPFDVSQWPKTIKVSASSQEWCGTSYVQLNLQGENYKASMHSYFENEADTEELIRKAVPEEDLFSRIRLNPDLLPRNTFDLIPSQVVSRFLHLPLKAYPAKAELNSYTGSSFEGDALMVYRIEIPALKRTVQIVFESQSPYLIRGWTDSYPGPFSNTIDTTTARLTHRIKEAYWKLNSSEDEDWRQKLGLD